MRKIILLMTISAGLLAFTQASFAQKKDVVSIKTATIKNGYTVLNPGEKIIIYKYVHAAHSPKEVERYAPKYYFSTGDASELRLLTKDNLKAAFPGNHKFHDALDATFKEDKNLYEYDNFHKMYKVNHLLMMN